MRKKKLTRRQRRLDVNKNGRIDKKDFLLLRKRKKRK
jgi:hypothetical protein